MRFRALVPETAGQQNTETKKLRKTKSNFTKARPTLGDFNAPLPKFGVLSKQKISKDRENLSCQSHNLFLIFTEYFTFNKHTFFIYVYKVEAKINYVFGYKS